MNKQLYRKLEAGDMVQEGDLIFMEEKYWEDIDPSHIGEKYTFAEAALRPVSITAGDMTLREHYAGLAMQALLPFFRDKGPLSEIAVASADALIAALNKKEEAV